MDSICTMKHTQVTLHTQVCQLGNLHDALVMSMPARQYVVLLCCIHYITLHYITLHYITSGVPNLGPIIETSSSNHLKLENCDVFIMIYFHVLRGCMHAGGHSQEHPGRSWTQIRPNAGKTLSRGTKRMNV
jgi:hypothetical protein